MRCWFDPGWFPYGKCYAITVMILGITLSFAVLAPAILFASIPYFVLSPLVYRYQLLYVYEVQFESGGSYEPHVIASTVLMMYFCEATALGVFLLDSYVTGVLLTALLMVITSVYANHAYNLYKNPLQHLPREMASQQDTLGSNGLGVVPDLDLDAESDDGSTTASRRRDDFLNPLLAENRFVRPSPAEAMDAGVSWGFSSPRSNGVRDRTFVEEAIDLP